MALAAELPHLSPGAVLSVVLPAPAGLFTGPLAVAGEWAYWARPVQQERRFGFGRALWREVAEPAQLAAVQREVARAWRWLDRAGAGMAPAAFTGFAFAPAAPMSGPWAGLPGLWYCLPALQLHCREERYTLAFTTGARTLDTAMAEWECQAARLREAMTAVVPPSRPTAIHPVEEVPAAGHWMDAVTAALAAIESGTLEKVVLARRVRCRVGQTPDSRRLSALLEHLYPGCGHFIVQMAGRIFAAATPERLLACRAGWVSADAVGGTAPSCDTDDRGAVAAALLAGAKSQHEHDLVVKGVRQAMEDVCSELRIPARPALLPLRHLQHLWTEIRGKLHPGVGLLDLAARLHPTPAVNGTPAAAARDWIAAREGLARGWYSGAGGWVDANGDGELSVLLRCALWQGRDVDLYAGAGIVAGSDPAAELAETELKLAVLREALASA